MINEFVLLRFSARVPDDLGGIEWYRSSIIISSIINQAFKPTRCSRTRASTVVRSSGMASLFLACSNAWASVSHASNSSNNTALPRTLRNASWRRCDRWPALISACKHSTGWMSGRLNYYSVMIKGSHSKVVKLKIEAHSTCNIFTGNY